MRNLWILTRFLLKSGPGKSNQKSGKKKAFSDGGRIVVYLLLGVCLLPVSVLLFLLGYSGYTFLQPLGLETLLIEFVCAIGMMVIFFYGLPLFLSEYYMDSDLVKLLPLPFTPAQIVGAKGFCCLLNEYYLIVLLFFLFLLGYGISAKMGIFYWINMILACLIFPVVPLVYAAVLTMLVMRLFKNIRNKDFLSYLGFAASLIFAIGINVFSRSIGNFEMQDIMNLMESQKGTLRAFRTIFPNLPLMTGSLADASFLEMILYNSRHPCCLFRPRLENLPPGCPRHERNHQRKTHFIQRRSDPNGQKQKSDPHLRDDRMEKTVPNPGLVHELCSDASHLAGLHAWHCPRFGHFQPWHG